MSLMKYIFQKLDIADCDWGWAMGVKGVWAASAWRRIDESASRQMNFSNRFLLRWHFCAHLEACLLEIFGHNIEGALAYL